jgi:hypothetical protein
MNQNVLIHKKNKKVCNIEDHYELLIIEFNPVPIKEMIAKQEDDDLIKQKDDGLIQKEDNPIIKTLHTDQIVTSKNEDDVLIQANCEKDDLVQATFEAMTVNFEDKNSSHASVNSMNSNSD